MISSVCYQRQSPERIARSKGTFSQKKGIRRRFENVTHKKSVQHYDYTNILYYINHAEFTICFNTQKLCIYTECSLWVPYGSRINSINQMIFERR